MSQEKGSIVQYYSVLSERHGFDPPHNDIIIFQKNSLEVPPYACSPRKDSHHMILYTRMTVVHLLGNLKPRELILMNNHQSKIIIIVAIELHKQLTWLNCILMHRRRNIHKVGGAKRKQRAKTFDHAHISFEARPSSNQRGCVTVKQEVFLL